MPNTVLIIDDSEGAREHIRRVLSDNPPYYRTLSAPNGLDGFMALVSSPVDLVLCNVTMPVMDGFKFLGLKSTRPDLVDIPVIMLTATNDVNQKVKALESGATDYLTKPFHASELLARVRVHLQLRSFQRELRKKNAELEILSNTDGLTGLANRRHFLEVANIELVRAAQHRTPLAAVMVDIDHFKNVNDGFGHLIGDRLLRGVADVLRSDLRRGDLSARYGGEEFALILPGTTMAGAEAVAQRYRDKIGRMHLDVSGCALSMRTRGTSQHPVLAAAGTDAWSPASDSWSMDPPPWTPGLKVTASFGVAAFPEHDAETIEDLLRYADRALYRAKASGRDQVVVADAVRARA